MFFSLPAYPLIHIIPISTENENFILISLISLHFNILLAVNTSSRLWILISLD